MQDYVELRLREAKRNLDLATTFLKIAVAFQAITIVALVLRLTEQYWR